MLFRSIFLTSVIAASCFANACATATEQPTAPTSVESSSGQSRTTPPQSTPPSTLQPGDCDAAKAQWAVGERASDRLLERARVAAEAKSARFLKPNQRITMEYSSSRLNLETNLRDVVIAVRCG
jgi:Peptidase inhibitor I78 family